MVENDAPLEAHDVVKKPSRYPVLAGVFIVLLIVVAVGMYTGYSLRSSCEVSVVEETSAILISQAKHYDDVYQSATAATRTSAVVPVAVMQQILMDTKDVGVPACMQTTKEELIHYMRTVNQAFQAYGSGESDAAIRILIDEAYTHLDAFTTELDAVKECAPYCLP